MKRIRRIFSLIFNIIAKLVKYWLYLYFVSVTVLAIGFVALCIWNAIIPWNVSLNHLIFDLLFILCGVSIVGYFIPIILRSKKSLKICFSVAMIGTIFLIVLSEMFSLRIRHAKTPLQPAPGAGAYLHTLDDSLINPNDTDVVE